CFTTRSFLRGEYSKEFELTCAKSFARRAQRYYTELLLFTQEPGTIWFDLGRRSRSSLSDRNSSVSRYWDIFNRSHGCGAEANGWVNRRRAHEPIMVSCHRGASQQLQPNVPPALPRLHDQDTHNVHSEFGDDSQLEQHSGRREVDRPAHFPSEPNPKDRKTTGQYSDRREILRRLTAVRT